VSMLDAAIHYMRPRFAEYLASGVAPQRNGNLDPNPTRKTFCQAIPCLGGGDNDYCIVEIDTDDEWRSLIAATGLAAAGDDPRFATRELRYQYAAELRNALTSWVAIRPSGRRWTSSFAAGFAPRRCSRRTT